MSVFVRRRQRLTELHFKIIVYDVNVNVPLCQHFPQIDKEHCVDVGISHWVTRLTTCCTDFLVHVDLTSILSGLKFKGD